MNKHGAKLLNLSTESKERPEPYPIRWRHHRYVDNAGAFKNMYDAFKLGGKLLQTSCL